MSSSKWDLLPSPVNGTSSQDPGRNELYPALAYILEEVRRDTQYQQQLVEESLSTAELELYVARICLRLGFELSPIERDQLLALLEKDRNTFGLLQGLIEDPSISDIIVSGPSSITVQQGRQTIRTSLRFPSQDFYEAFVEKLLARAATTYSTKKPIADGMVDSFARIHAVHRALCEGGPYLTIRLNRFETVTMDELVAAGMAPQILLSYLSHLVRQGQTMLIVGEVGTGKTTLARALASEMPQQDSILVIEDTPEIKLAHPHVRYLRTREQNIEGEGRVAPGTCIRAGMRMAMNRIVFGEIRDAEAAEAFVDVCASGHPGLSTLHARSASEAITRLELLLGRSQPGVGRAMLQQQIATSVGAIVHVAMCGITRKRRIFEVRELGGVADQTIRQKHLFQYQVVNSEPTWKILSRSSLQKSFIEEEFDLTDCPPLLTLEKSVERSSGA